MNHHLLMAILSKASYNDSVHLINHRTKFYSRGGCQAFLLTSNHRQILVFRGTEANEKTDWVVDAIFLPADGVQLGFRMYLSYILEDIMNDIKYDMPLYVTGHSLGGALATLFTSHIDHSDMTLYTFGSPKVGTKKFVNKLRVVHYRWAKAYDHATILPFWPYTHHGTLMYIDSKGKYTIKTWFERLLDRIGLPKYYENHSIDTYIDAISESLELTV